MQRHLAVSAALLLAACGSSSPKKLIILHTNDEHSHMLGFGPESDDFPAPTVAGTGTIKGGAARRAVMLAAERAKAKSGGADVLTVSAGDNAMGTLEQLAFSTVGADFRLMKLLGYDVTTLGNHEFDYGPKQLAAAMIAAKGSSEGMPVVVASNINFSGGAGDAELVAQFEDGHADASKPLHRSWVITTPNGLKVGFIGVMGVNAASLAPLKKPVVFSVGGSGDETDFAAALIKLYGDLQKVATALRTTDKVDLVVALSHSGVDSTTPSLGEDYLIAQSVPGIDVIVSGHSHTDYKGQIVTNTATGRPVMVQQAGRFGDHIGRISLSVDGNKVSFDTVATDILPVSDTTVGDTAISGFVSAVIDGVEKSAIVGSIGLIFGAPIPAATTVGDIAFKPVAKSSFTVDNSTWQKETPLLRLSADAYLKTVESQIAPTDLAVQGAGVLRADLQPNKKGELSFSDIFRAEPLGASPVTGTVGYPLARFGIYLAEIKAAFEVTAGLAYTSETNGDFYLVPSGMCFEYDTSRKPYDPGGALLDQSNGRVTKISQATDHTKLDVCDKLLFDALNTALAPSGGYTMSPLTVFNATTNLYVTTFAYLAGVKLKDPADPTKTITPAQAVVFRKPPLPANTEIKEWEALGGYVRALSPAPGTGDLPASYKKDAPITRAICKAGPLCK